MMDEQLSSEVLEVHVHVHGAQLVLRGEATTMRVFQFESTLRAGLGLLSHAEADRCFP